jgi:hypothetical protein
MSIIRVEKNKNYTTMNNHVLRDKSLSWQAKGIAAYLLSMPDDWNLNSRHLSTASRNGVDSVRTILNELVSAGYLVRNMHRNSDGQFLWEQVFYETPHEPGNTSDDDGGDDDGMVEAMTGKAEHGEASHILSTKELIPIAKAIGATSAPTLPLAEQFASMVTEMGNTKNKVPLLIGIYKLCFGCSNLPPGGEFAGAARQVGSASLLAKYMFDNVTRPPVGPILPYIIATHKGNVARANKFNGGVKETKLMFNNGVNA